MVRAVHIWALIVLISGLPVHGAGASPDPASNRLAEVRGFALDYDSGSMALHALKSCLKTYGIGYPYGRFVGFSGAAFKFVYDSTEAYEPLRDIYPVDVLQTACASLGLPDAHWEINRPIEEVKKIVKREIDAGRPLISPFLKHDAYHGFFIITGYDYVKGVFYLQGAFKDSSGAEVPIPDGWDGPTASPAGWAGNPVFIIGEPAGEGFSPRDIYYKDTIELGITIMEGGTLTYGSHRGEQVYMARPGPHQAHYGLEAYGLLSGDVATEALTFERDGVKHLNFGFIWRIDAQLGQLEHDRRNGAGFLQLMVQGLPYAKKSRWGEIVDNFRLAAEGAGDLRLVFWDEVPDTLTSSGMVAEYVRSSPSIVFRLPDRDGLREELEGEGFEIYRSPWGWVLTDDTGEKRLAARLLVRTLMSREKNSLRMLEDIVEYVDKRTDPDRVERKHGPKKRE